MQRGRALRRLTHWRLPQTVLRRLCVEPLEERAMLSLVAAYAFDEGQGTSVADMSGNGNSGTLAGATWSASGKYGMALSFNGSSALMSVADSASLDLTTGMTLEAWVNPTSTSSLWRDVIYKSSDIYYLEGSSPLSQAPAIGGTFSSTPLYGTTALAAGAWSHLAATYDGATMRLYVNGTQVASRSQSGPIHTSTGALSIGGDTLFGQYFAGLIDEVRIYNIALTQTDIQTDMNTPVDTLPDTQAPTAPGSLIATAVSMSQINLSWSAAIDNVAVTGYLMERRDPGSMTYSQIATSSGTTFSDTGLATGSAYSYRVRAADAAGNLGAYSPVASATTLSQPDTTAPSAAITGPSDGATAGGTITVTAVASDNVGVAGVQFLLDGAPLGAEDTMAPYSISWDTTIVAGGAHLLSARARDFAGNSTVSNAITVQVTNANDPALVGQWSSVMNWPLVAINMVLLDDGKILMWSGQNCIGGTSACVWDPATNIFTSVALANPDNTERDIFCSGQVALADGRILQVGGHSCVDPSYLGAAISTIFDPATQQWTPEPDMAYHRWYPTATTLADGRVIVIGGGDRDFTAASYNHTPEVFDPRTNTWTTLSNANQVIPNYAFIYVLPDGRVLAAGSDEALMATYALDVATQTWSVVDPTVLDAGSSVMYLPGKVMKAGASYIAGNLADYQGIPSAPNTYVLDMTQASPAWQQTASMAYSRTDLNLTVLPDGNVLATGGSSDISGEFPQYAVMPAELWSPTTESWTTMASMSTPRMYHSTALLMPDGRILSAGGGRTGDPVSFDFQSAEYYSPPYLFKGARPSITAPPTTVNYNSSFFVQTPDAASIASVSLIRNGSVTHGVNMDQRFVPLAFSQGSGGLNVQAPADANLAPPGYYMLFIVNSNGVPSIAPMVRLPAAYEDVQSPTAPATLVATGGVGTAIVTWSAATDNTAVVHYNVYRSTTPGFDPSAANLVAQPTATNYTDPALTAGRYYYRVTAEDAAGNVGAASPEASAMVVSAQVVGRKLFYNQSGTASPVRYDGNNSAINSLDDNAIATDKTAYIPGSGAATFANVSSYTKGINGIMIDIAGTHGTITSDDFTFRMGNNNSPNTWGTAPAPLSISVRADAGMGGSDRVEIIWNNALTGGAHDAVYKKWLEVIVKANANTGLSQLAGAAAGIGDVFLFGNAVGDSGKGDTSTNATVDTIDELEARNHPASALTNVPITNTRDYNRDAAVDSSDGLVSRNNATTLGTVMRFLNLTLANASPDGGDSGPVASALTMPATTSGTIDAPPPRWLVNHSESVESNRSGPATFAQCLAERNGLAARRLPLKTDEVASTLQLDDSLLDSVLDDLG